MSLEGLPPTERPVAFEVSTLLVRRPSGVGVYGEGLIRALAARRPDRAHWQIYRWSRAGRRSLCPAPELPGCAFLSGARLHRRFGLVHALDTRIPCSFRGPLVATLFDVISALPLASERSLSSPRFIARKLRDYSRIRARADLVITLSAETRERFLSLGPARGRVVVVPPGVAPEFLKAGTGPLSPDRRGRLGLPGRYLLAVGALCPRKNLLAVMGAFRRARVCEPDLRLVVVGEPGRGWESDPARREILSLGALALPLGYLDREDLAAVYAGAAALLYLSHYEGFGLPVLEAMAAGAPVVASRRGGIPEAAGEAALLVDPDCAEEIDGALRRILAGGSEVRSLRERGRAQAARFTWDAAARAVDAAYREALTRFEYPWMDPSGALTYGPCRNGENLRGWRGRSARRSSFWDPSRPPAGSGPGPGGSS